MFMHRIETGTRSDTGCEWLKHSIFISHLIICELLIRIFNVIFRFITNIKLLHKTQRTDNSAYGFIDRI